LKAKAIWENDMAFTGSTDGRFTVRMDASEEVGGHDSGFRPTDLLVIGLAGCTGMDVISILKKKRQEVTSFQVLVNAQKAEEHPKVFTQIQIEYVVTGKNIDPSAVERAVELSETRYCPSIAMLGKTAEITHKITINQA
jgi:putative redox protein